MADETVNVQVTGSQTISGPAGEAAAAIERLTQDLQNLQASAQGGVAIPQSVFAQLNAQIAEQTALLNSATGAWQAYTTAASVPPPPAPPGGGGSGGRAFEFSLGPETDRSISSARASASTFASS